MGKGARNRRIRADAREIAQLHGGRSQVSYPQRVKTIARLYRREVVKFRRRKEASKPKGPTVWRWPRPEMLGESTDGRRFRDRLKRG